MDKIWTWTFSEDFCLINFLLHWHLSSEMMETNSQEGSIASFWTDNIPGFPSFLPPLTLCRAKVNVDKLSPRLTLLISLYSWYLLCILQSPAATRTRTWNYFELCRRQNMLLNKFEWFKFFLLNYRTSGNAGFLSLMHRFIQFRWTFLAQHPNFQMVFIQVVWHKDVTFILLTREHFRRILE